MVNVGNSVRLPPRLSRACPLRLFTSSRRVSAPRLILSSLSEADFHLKQESNKMRRRKKKIDECSFSSRCSSPRSLSPAVSDSAPSFLFIHVIMPSAAFPISLSLLALLLWLSLFHGGILILTTVYLPGALTGSSERPPQAAADTRTHVTY